MGEATPLGTGGGFGAQGNNPQTGITWYETQLFLSRLYQLTGRVYRLATEAEWELAAKGGFLPGWEETHAYRFAGSNDPNEVLASGGGFGGSVVASRMPNTLGLYDMSGNVEEWVYNSWNGSHRGGHNPTGTPGAHLHDQKTRRGGSGGAATNGVNTTRYLTARLIRSVDGADGGIGIRLALSADENAAVGESLGYTMPGDMLRPCDIRRPFIDDSIMENENPFRDSRLVTGDDFMWTGGFSARPMKLWESGEVTVAGFGGGGAATVGQWYTVNNMALVIVQNSGARIQFAYMFMDYDLMTMFSDSSGMPSGRITLLPDTRAATASGRARPTIPEGLIRTPEYLAETSTHDHSLVDMTNIPHSARGQDPRLLSPEGHGWWMGITQGGTHTYRKDVDEEEFRFVVYQTAGGSTMLSNGSWFTVNDVFLQVTHPNGYVTQYLYVVTPGTGTGSSSPGFSHISFQWYERGDSRTFRIHPNASITGHTNEIGKGQGVSIYASRQDGQSSFRMPEFPVNVINGTGSGGFKQGDTVKISANAPPAGHRFVRWTATPNVIFGNPNAPDTDFFMVHHAVNVTAIFEPVTVPAGRVIVNSLGTGSTGSGEYAAGETVTIFAGTAPPGQQFARWATSTSGITFTQVGSVTTNRGRHTFVMPANGITVTAIFEPIPAFLVNLNSRGLGASGSGVFPAGTRVELFAGTPPPGYRFARWATTLGSGSGSISITPADSAQASFTMPSRFVLVSAIFEYDPNWNPPLYTVTFEPNNGNLQSGVLVQEIYEGHNATPPVVTRAGHTFAGWHPAGGYINITENTTLTALWRQDGVATQTVTFSAGAGGSVTGGVVTSVNGSAAIRSIQSGDEVEVGATVIFTATQPFGLRVHEWTISGGTWLEHTSQNSRSVVVGSSPIVANVTFENIPPSRVVNFATNNENGTITASVDGVPFQSGTYAEIGTRIDFTATPNDGHRIVTSGFPGGWAVSSGGGTLQPTGTGVGTMPNRHIIVSEGVGMTPLGPITVTVNFEPIPTRVLNFAANGQGTLTATVNGVPIQSGDEVQVGAHVQFTATAHGTCAVAWVVTPGGFGGVTLTGATADTQRDIASVPSATGQPPITVTANFGRVINLAVAAGGGGTISATINGASLPSGTAVPVGSVLEFTATPNFRHQITVWAAGFGNTLTPTGTANATAPVRGLTVASGTSAITVTVTFAPLPCEDCGEISCVCTNERVVTINPNGGRFTDPSIDPQGYGIRIPPDGTVIEYFSSVTREGYRFVGWWNTPEPTGGTRTQENTIITESLQLFARWVRTPQGFILGDPDGDRRITSADATFIARLLLNADAPIVLDENSSPYLLAADINGDGYVDINDIVLFARWLVGHDVVIA